MASQTNTPQTHDEIYISNLEKFYFEDLVNEFQTDPTYNKRFVVGVDRSKMKLYDAEPSAQHNILDGPVMDDTAVGKRVKEETIGQLKFNAS